MFGGKKKNFRSRRKGKATTKEGKKTNMVKLQRKVEEGGLPRGQGIFVIPKTRHSAPIKALTSSTSECNLTFTNSRTRIF